MPKDQFYHDYEKKWEKEKFDRRAQIMSSYRDSIISLVHQKGYARHKNINDKYTIGVPIFDSMREIGKLFPTHELLEQYNKTATDAAINFSGQVEFERQLTELNKKLRGSKKRPWESLGQLTRNEAEELRSLASKAFTEGAEGFDLKEPLVDSIQNSNFGGVTKIPGNSFNIQLPLYFEFDD